MLTFALALSFLLLLSTLSRFRKFILTSNLCIEDIYFFEVNTKYISSSELKTSKFSRVRSTRENLDVFNSRDERYLVFTNKK